MAVTAYAAARRQRQSKPPWIRQRLLRSTPFSNAPTGTVDASSSRIIIIIVVLVVIVKTHIITMQGAVLVRVIFANTPVTLGTVFHD